MPRKNRASTATPEGLAKRLRVHRHNGYKGHVTMGLQHMKDIMASASCTPEAKRTAAHILGQMTALRTLLDTRIDEEQKDA